MHLRHIFLGQLTYFLSRSPIKVDDNSIDYIYLRICTKADCSKRETSPEICLFHHLNAL